MKKNSKCVLSLSPLRYCPARPAWRRKSRRLTIGFRWGMEFEKSNVHEEAIKMYTEAIRYDRYYARGIFPEGEGVHGRSIKRTSPKLLQDFNRAIDLDPKNAEVYYERGLLNAFAINNEDARADMQTAASLGHKGAQQWLAPDRAGKARRKRARGGSGRPRSAEAEQCGRRRLTEEKAGKEPGEAFFAPGKRLPSGSEPVVRFDFNKADIKEAVLSRSR